MHDDKEVLDHVKACLLKAQDEDENPGDDSDKGIEKEPMKNLIKSKVMSCLEKKRSEMFDEIMSITKIKKMTDFDKIPKVIDDEETTDEIEIIDYHLELSKDPASNITTKQMITAIGAIGSMEHWTNMQVLIPIFEKIFQLIKSKYAYVTE